MQAQDREGGVLLLVALKRDLQGLDITDTPGRLSWLQVSPDRLRLPARPLLSARPRLPAARSPGAHTPTV